MENKQRSGVKVLKNLLRWFPGRLPVICCPFLGEGEPVLLDLVLGLQRACNLLKEQSDMQDKVLEKFQTFPPSVVVLPPAVNSTPLLVLLFTSNLTRPKW